MTIAFSPKHVKVSLPVARALLAFAGKAPLRPNVDVGIDDGALCATNGYIALAFETATGAQGRCGSRESQRHRLVTCSCRDRVEGGSRTKRTTVVLHYSDHERCQYPRLAHFFSAERRAVDQPICSLGRDERHAVSFQRRLYLSDLARRGAARRATARSHQFRRRCRTEGRGSCRQSCDLPMPFIGPAPTRGSSSDIGPRA